MASTRLSLHSTRSARSSQGYVTRQQELRKSKRRKVEGARHCLSNEERYSRSKSTGNNTALCCKTSQQQSWYEGKVSKEWAKTTFPSWHNCIRRIYLWTATKLEEVGHLVFWVVVLGVRRRRAATWARCSRVDSKPLGDGDSFSNIASAYISEQDGRMRSIVGVAVRRGAVALRCWGAVASLDHFRHDGGNAESKSTHDKQQWICMVKGGEWQWWWWNARGAAAQQDSDLLWWRQQRRRRDGSDVYSYQTPIEEPTISQSRSKGC